mmetsp:Transcript_122350/g.228663  ORF Transcript_122350/g.228663 Transcript_122350/m.228663 type:complete len:238 (-) Transcript_122350:1343-2056(-)
MVTTLRRLIADVWICGRLPATDLGNMLAARRNGSWLGVIAIPPTFILRRLLAAIRGCQRLPQIILSRLFATVRSQVVIRIPTTRRPHWHPRICRSTNRNFNRDPIYRNRPAQRMCLVPADALATYDDQLQKLFVPALIQHAFTAPCFVVHTHYAIIGLYFLHARRSPYAQAVPSRNCPVLQHLLDHELLTVFIRHHLHTKFHAISSTDCEAEQNTLTIKVHEGRRLHRGSRCRRRVS